MDEIGTFLKVLGQVIFTFKSEIFGILDTVMTPVLERILSSLRVTPSGTDDEIQLSELRREYLGFLIVVMNQGLGSVLVSSSMFHLYLLHFVQANRMQQTKPNSKT
jgi:exportin-T